MVGVGYGNFSLKPVNIYYRSARGAPDSGEVLWMFENSSAAGDMTVTDKSGLRLYNSGPHHSPYQFHYTWHWAGSYPFESTTTGTKDTVKVHMVRSPRSGAPGTVFTVKWASAGRTNCVFDVEIKRPGRAHYSFLKFGTTALSGSFTPKNAGYYVIRSRMRNTKTGKFSGFSPGALIHVT